MTTKRTILLLDDFRFPKLFKVEEENRFREVTNDMRFILKRTAQIELVQFFGCFPCTLGSSYFLGELTVEKQKLEIIADL